MTVPAIVLKVAPYVVAIGLLGGAWAEHNAHERALGAIQERLKSRDSIITVITKSRDSLATVFRSDTIRFAVWRTRYDTTVATLLDTILIHHTTHDTVRVPVRVLVTADSAYQSCKATIFTCEALVAKERQRADLYSAQLHDVMASQPSFIATWLPRLGALGVGYVVGRIKP